MNKTEHGRFTFGMNKRMILRSKLSNEGETRPEGPGPSQDENSYSRNIDSRRGVSRNSRQSNSKQVVNWLKGKTIGTCLQDLVGGDFQPINLSSVSGMDGVYQYKDSMIDHYTPNPDEYSLNDKIYEEDNEIYSSSHQNEELSLKDISEKSLDDITGYDQFIPEPKIAQRKDPSFLETLYNHKLNNDMERVHNARKRIEEKYSTNKWKLTKDVGRENGKLQSLVGIKKVRNDKMGLLTQTIVLNNNPKTPVIIKTDRSQLNESKVLQKKITNIGEDNLLSVMGHTPLGLQMSFKKDASKKLLERETGQSKREIKEFEPLQGSLTHSKGRDFKRGTFYNQSTSKSPYLKYAAKKPVNDKYTEMTQKLTKTSLMDGFYKVS